MSKTFPSARARFQSRHADQTIAAATLPKTRKIPAPKRIACTRASLPEGGGRTTHSPPRRATRTHRTMLGRWRPSRARLDDRFALASVCWLGRQDDERHLCAAPLPVKSAAEAQSMHRECGRSRSHESSDLGTPRRERSHRSVSTTNTPSANATTRTEAPTTHFPAMKATMLATTRIVTCHLEIVNFECTAVLRTRKQLRRPCAPVPRPSEGQFGRSKCRLSRRPGQHDG
jgi:hypothetical protein